MPKSAKKWRRKWKSPSIPTLHILATKSHPKNGSPVRRNSAKSAGCGIDFLRLYQGFSIFFLTSRNTHFRAQATSILTLMRINSPLKQYRSSILMNRYIEHTILKPETTEKDVLRLIDEAFEYNFVGTCVPPFWVKKAARELRGSPIQLVTVIGFPLGY